MEAVLLAVRGAGRDVDEIGEEDANRVGEMITKLQAAEREVVMGLEERGVDLKGARFQLDAQEYAVWGGGVVDPRLIGMTAMLLHYFELFEGERRWPPSAAVHWSLEPLLQQSWNVWDL